MHIQLQVTWIHREIYSHNKRNPMTYFCKLKNLDVINQWRIYGVPCIVLENFANSCLLRRGWAPLPMANAESALDNFFKLSH